MYKLIINEDIIDEISELDIPKFRTEIEIEEFFENKNLSLCKMTIYPDKTIYVEVPEGMVVFRNKNIIYKSYRINNIEKYVKGKEDRLFNVMRKYYDIGLIIKIPK